MEHIERVASTNIPVSIRNLNSQLEEIVPWKIGGDVHEESLYKDNFYFLLM